MFTELQIVTLSSCFRNWKHDRKELLPEGPAVPRTPVPYSEVDSEKGLTWAAQGSILWKVVTPLAAKIASW